VGSPNIRLGAPNRFTVHLHNVSNTEAEPFMVVLSVTDDIVFKQVEITNDTGKIIYPIDSIGSVNDNTQLFYIPYLDPYDDYSFDVIVMGVNPGTKSVQTETGLTAAALVSNTGYTISEVMADDAQAVRPMDDDETKEYEKRLGLQGKKYKAEKSKIEPYRKVVAETLIEIFDKVPGTKIISKIGSVFEFLKDNAVNIRQRVYLAIQRDLDPKYDKKAKVVSPKVVKGKIVASKDPNEKIGLSGYGTSNFIASAGKMNYTIFFENMKEATAPAYRVQILDTLSAVFDPETVKFGPTSHSGPNYKWKMERNGNIIKWDIEEIELPPNITPPEGEGFVTFSAELKKDLPSGTKIENAASIIFDINPPIRTNTWTNIFDKVAPKTIMNPINYSGGDTLVTISCTSTDNSQGSGINRFLFFASVNNGPFTLLGESFKNSMDYTVSAIEKNSYRFYALAIDNVENMETSIPQIAELKSFPVSSAQVGIENQKVKIYPNPATEKVYIDILTETGVNVNIKIFSTEGKLIKESDSDSFTVGKHTFEIDLSQFKTGVYFVQVVNGSISETYKLLRK
jgi:hypothetical protein